MLHYLIGLFIVNSLIQFVNYTDVKSYFGSTSRNSVSDSNLGRSTHESGNVAQSEEQEVLYSLETVQETVQGNILFLIGCFTNFAQNMYGVIVSQNLVAEVRLRSFFGLASPLPSFGVFSIFMFQSSFN